MIKHALIFGLATVAFASTMSVRATVIDEPEVNDAAIIEDNIPRTLAEFGFFFDDGARQPNYRVTPYQLNTPLYSDGADKLRYIYLPEGTRLTADDEGLLKFPVGAAMIKTFAFGEGEDQRFVETRVLLNRPEGWVALPYRWNEEQTEAKLALAGARLPVTTPDGSEISYRIPNKNQCKTCHSKDGDVVPIGPKARNLSSEWLNVMVRNRHLDRVPIGADALPDWGSKAEHTMQSLARGYLDVNCAHCHQPGGGASNSGLDLRWEQEDPHAIGIRKPPVAAGRGSGGHAVSILPGDPDASILVYR
ncbi:MAG: hypothetical protein AAGK02_17185, partial [Pseudomonadota bacterium]